MPFVNLIHETRLLQKQQERKVRSLLAGWIGVGSLSLIGAATLALSTESVYSQTSELKKKLTRIQPVMKQIDEGNRQLAVMGPKLTSLESAQTSTMRWTNILTHFTLATPERVWLTNVKSKKQSSKEPMWVNLTGLSTDQEGVAEFMLKLKNCPDLEKIELKYTAPESSGPNSTNIKYEIQASVAGTGTDEKAKGKADKSGKKSADDKGASA